MSFDRSRTFWIIQTRVGDKDGDKLEIASEHHRSFRYFQSQGVLQVSVGWFREALFWFGLALMVVPRDEVNPVPESSFSFDLEA